MKLMKDDIKYVDDKRLRNANMLVNDPNKLDIYGIKSKLDAMVNPTYPGEGMIAREVYAPKKPDLIDQWIEKGAILSAPDANGKDEDSNETITIPKQVTPTSPDAGNGSTGSPNQTEGEQNGNGTGTGSEVSKTVSDASAYIEGLLTQMRNGRTSYSDERDRLIDEFKNRQFNYDPNSDPLYQNYLAAMQNAGQLAMKDTMGQAAALTGGYGSSYATQAANGAYNNYLQQANQALPDYYNMALNQYNAQGDELLNRINLATNQDDTEWNRLYNMYQSASGGKEPYTNTQYNNIRDELTKIFNEEGIDAFNAALELKKDLPEEEKDAIEDWVIEHGENHYTMTYDANILEGMISNNRYKNSFGEEFTYTDLKKKYENGEISKETWDAIKDLHHKGDSTRG